MAAVAGVDAQAIADAAGSVDELVVALRRTIHRHPEIGLELPRTQAAVRDALADLPLEVRSGRELTSLVADLDGTAGVGPTVLLRADMDALPMPEDTELDFASEVDGAMHACGHDAHAAMLVGAAHVLTGMRDSLAGRVRFMFQPGEEGHHGARSMIEEGVLDGVREAFAIHVAPNVPAGFVVGRPGPFLASADELTIEITGRGGHGGTPHLANDPIPVAAELIGAIQTFVARRVDAFDPAVVTIGSITAGTTTNVVPENATMIGTIRTTSERTRSFVHKGLDRLVAGVTAAHEMTGTVRIDEGYPVTSNHSDSYERARRVTRSLLGDDRFFEMPTPATGAEDFSYVLQRVPGTMVFLGVCPQDTDIAKAPGCHCNRMVLNEDALATGVALNVAMALSMLAE